jgi:hypothetical protein
LAIYVVGRVQGFKEKGLKAGFISLISSIGSIGSNDQALGVRQIDCGLWISDCRIQNAKKEKPRFKLKAQG